MLTFALVLLLTLDGNTHAFTMDHSLTQKDCEQALADNPQLAATGRLQCVVEVK
jgi:hypothetical protein